MPPTFQEIDCRQTHMGELILRVRRSPSLNGASVYEVTLDGEFLMSSAVHRSETALAELALETFGDRPCDVLVGGLGLGHTAVAALRDDRVRRLDVVESLEPVIGWFRDRLVPAAETLMDDPRCTLIHDDFFRRVGEPAGNAGPRYDLILVDIDHSPSAWLDDAHQRFYHDAGLQRLKTHLSPAGVFALWSADPVGDPFLDRLGSVFKDVREHPVSFHHPMLHREERNTVVVARDPGPASG